MHENFIVTQIVTREAQHFRRCLQTRWQGKLNNSDVVCKAVGKGSSTYQTLFVNPMTLQDQF